MQWNNEKDLEDFFIIDSGMDATNFWKRLGCPVGKAEYSEGEQMRFNLWRRIKKWVTWAI